MTQATSITLMIITAILAGITLVLAMVDKRFGMTSSKWCQVGYRDELSGISSKERLVATGLGMHGTRRGSKDEI